jgi:hypothetical protein
MTTTVPLREYDTVARADLSVTCDRSVVFFGYFLVSSTDKTDRHDITEILLKVALNTISQTKPKPNLAGKGIK